METAKLCLECKEPIKGRSDKKFCSDLCRNAFNYSKNSFSTNYIRNISNTLKRNRRILNSLCVNDTAKVSRQVLLAKGFSFEFFTHTRTTKKGQTYYFVFDYGYLMLEENLYLLVQDSSVKN